MPGSVSTYAFVNARIRTRLSSLLSPDVLSRLVDARDLAEFASMLGGTPYEPIFSQPEAVAEPRIAERLLIEDEIDWYRDLIKTLKGRERALVETMLEKYELESLKVALRVREGGRDKRELVNVVQRELPNKLRYQAIADARTLDDVLPLLAGTPYLRPMRASLDACKQRGTLFPAEIALEIDFYGRVQEQVERLSRADRLVARRLIGIEIDMQNVMWLLRLKFYYGFPSGDLVKYLIPGGFRLTKGQLRQAFVPDSMKDVLTVLALITLEREFSLAADLLRDEEEIGKLYLLEVILWRHLLLEAKKMFASYPFSIGTIIGYLVLKRTEIRMLITILNGKALKLDRAEIESNLRMAF
jgi:vacuolar-type H+-ATPase subunit C/Vma6